MKGKSFLTGVIILFTASNLGLAEKLPIPTYDNSVIISIEHNINDSAEIEYIQENFNFGLYAWPCYSKTTTSVELGWKIDWNDASDGIQGFKDSVNQMIASAKQHQVKLHLVLAGGLARVLSVYREAKQEDIRNCSWYNDNKLAADNPAANPDDMDTYVFGTLSRYARKVRANLEAKSKAALAFLKQRMDQEPGIIAGISGWAEAEMNYRRADHSVSLQPFFCDYSPFAVLEFRDWIRHTGLYDAGTGKYQGEGYSQGGARYQGAGGLVNFNTDFGTGFQTWDLKYYHWSLVDDYDQNPTDDVNNDPHRIPFAGYAHGNMMPSSGENYTAGGFDPPREMERTGRDAFWDLWNLFRETMVHKYVNDMAKWASEAGIPTSMWYSHQIPADYLYGTNPDTENKNARYYSSASPLWTADIKPYGSMGATIYDNKFPDWFARTTEHALPAISSMSPNWAIMEYDPETYPYGLDVTESSVGYILEQYKKIYQYRAHLINFWRWIDSTGEHKIKDMNKEKALGQFIQLVRDKARRTDLSVVFDPPKVVEFSGWYEQSTGAIHLEISGRIWLGHEWMWKEWGDFSYFEIYRGENPGFHADTGHFLAKITDYAYVDNSVQSGVFYYYKIRAHNVNGVAGPLSDEIKMPAYTLMLAAGDGGTTDPEPGIYLHDPGDNVAITALPYDDFVFAGWSGDASGNANPYTVLMDRNRNIAASFLEALLEPPLNFRGQKVINRSLTQEECINVLNWDPNPENDDVEHYRIYQWEDGAQDLLAELGAATYEYARRRVIKSKQYTYAITAVDNRNKESYPATVTIN